MEKKLLFFILLISNIGSAQFIGARNEALANSFTTQKDILSSTENIAKLAELNSLNIGFSSKNALLIKELQQSNLAIGIPLKKGSCAFSIYHFGFQLYKESNFSIAYSFPFSPDFSLGLKFNFHFININELNTKRGVLYPDLGLNYKLNERLEFGIVLTNLTLSKISSNPNHIYPSTANIGFKYSVNKQLAMFLESMFGVNEKIRIKYGLEYQIHKLFSFLIGIKNHPSSFSMGFGINLKKFHLDLASSYQAFLGFSPSLSLRFEAFK